MLDSETSASASVRNLLEIDEVLAEVQEREEIKRNRNNSWSTNSVRNRSVSSWTRSRGNTMSNSNENVVNAEANKTDAEQEGEKKTKMSNENKILQTRERSVSYAVKETNSIEKFVAKNLQR
jgi:hypothetical protein